MGNVEFKDYSLEVEAALDETAIAWLREWSNEIASHAQRNCSKEGWTNGEYTNLRDGYAARVDDSNGTATVGHPMEMAYWEEWGTGEYAAHGDGRDGWWIYTPGSNGPAGYQSNTYQTREEAEEMAAYIREKYGKPAIVTNGRRPNYTLERAFEKNTNKAIEDLKKKLKDKMGE